MSKYEDYNNVAKNYDSQRFAMGADVIAAMIQFHCGKPLKDLHVLDAGCGTGNYAKALLDFGVGHVTLLDASSGMLDKAKEKLTSEIASGKVKAVVEASMPPLPFPDASFDVVMFNLVFHHLDGDDTEEFPKCVEALKEACRVLRRHGIIEISTVLPFVITHAVWYAQLNMDLTTRFLKIMPSFEQFEYMFKSGGVKCLQKLNILGSDLTQNYYNFRGPLDEKWRSSVSYWGFATNEELEEVKHKVLELKQHGELEKWCRDRDHVNEAGFLSIFFCGLTEQDKS